MARISPSQSWSKGLTMVGWIWWRHQRQPAPSPQLIRTTNSRPCRFPCHFVSFPLYLLKRLCSNPVTSPIGSLIALSVPLLVCHVSLSCIHKLRYLFCQVELFSCRHWQRELFQAFRIQQQVRALRLTAFVKHAPAFEFWVVVVTRHRSRLKGHTSFRFRLASRLTDLFVN